MPCSITLELIGDTSAKQFAVTGEIRNSLFAILFVVAGNLCWQHMLCQGIPLGVGGVLFGGALFHGETLTLTKLAGAGFGLVALVLLSL